MARGFQGAWRVREYVYAPDGTALGCVRQRRVVEAEGYGLRVAQDCWPDPSLDGHPMAEFRGHHEFTVTVDGAMRHYHGPAVVGSGWALGDCCMVGRGLWPSFGWSFGSWAALCAPDRQLTGGVFGRAGTPMAHIVGIAVPEAGGDDEPLLAGPSWPGDVARRWHGTITRVTREGVGARADVTRVYDGAAYVERAGRATIELTAMDDGGRVEGRFGGRAFAGFARRHGWSWSVEVVAGPETIVESLETLDATGGHLVALRRISHDLELVHIEVVQLRPVRQEHT